MAFEERNASSFSSGGDPTSSPGKRPSTHNPGGLLRRILIAFFLLALIAVGVNVKFLLDTSAEISRHAQTGPDQMTSRIAGAPGDTLATLQAARQRIAILLGVTVICFGAVIYLFVKRVVVPLNLVTRMAKDLSRGNLSVSALRNPHGDVGELGAALNDLAANFQEILLLMGTTVGNFSTAIDKIAKALEKESPATSDEIREQLKILRKDLFLLRSLVQEFEFYQTRFDGQKVVSDNTGRES